MKPNLSKVIFVKIFTVISTGCCKLCQVCGMGSSRKVRVLVLLRPHGRAETFTCGIGFV